MVWFGVVWLVRCGLGWFGGLVWCGLVVWFGWYGVVIITVVWLREKPFTTAPENKALYEVLFCTR